ncbi:hypothetical protein ACO0LB_18035 [Undibacterium sp. SXout7W]|uniref:hypothetical protein n=1 Tax=Undibacterium sp. SXout7W TaxID=3413049 RepID=UPI003BF32FD6
MAARCAAILSLCPLWNSSLVTQCPVVRVLDRILAVFLVLNIRVFSLVLPGVLLFVLAVPVIDISLHTPSSIFALQKPDALYMRACRLGRKRLASKLATFQGHLGDRHSRSECR